MGFLKTLASNIWSVVCTLEQNILQLCHLRYHNQNQNYLYQKKCFSLLFCRWVFLLSQISAMADREFIQIAGQLHCNCSFIPRLEKARRQYFIILSTRCTSKDQGSFNNHVDHILPNYDHLPPSSQCHIVQVSYLQPALYM